MQRNKTPSTAGAALRVEARARILPKQRDRRIKTTETRGPVRRAAGRARPKNAESARIGTALPKIQKERIK